MRADYPKDGQLNMRKTAGFDGAKVALLLGDRLVVILRDDLPGLAHAGCWDLPGGGREGDETPLECVLRECFEELGLRLASSDFGKGYGFEGPRGVQWFLTAQVAAEKAGDIVFGEEGQRWTLMPVQSFISHPKGIPHLQSRMRTAVDERWWDFRESPPLP